MDLGTAGIISAGIGAAGSLAGGLLSGMPQGAGKGFAREMWQKNYDAQLEFAKNRIRWRVEDAKAAGLHPLAALGTSSYFSPSGSISSIDSGGGSDASWLADAGQSIGRGIMAKATAEERAKAEAVNDRVNALRIEGLELDNQQKKLDQATQLAQQVVASQSAVRNTALPPAMPSLRIRPDGATVGTIMPGQGDSTGSSLWEQKPPEITINEPTRPAQENGSIPEVTLLRTAYGGYAPARSKGASDLFEEDNSGQVGWFLRNRLLPFLLDDWSPSRPPDHNMRPGDNGWVFNPITQEWKSYNKDKFLDYPKRKFTPW
ncbi:hypothetical protein [uncultured Desulfovibrio sp.]|uniref:hypothetical protein n=1 Tax=uncultured Desulfovibrio sp. TaxID=167968 RepID=UPI0028038E81|nr:hypothetical protein [uncultured Desulfovibrio sp.]